MLFRTVATVLAAFVVGVRSQTFPNPEAVSGNTAIHDPTMCKDASGTYWLFGTGTGIEIRTSPDRVTWTLVGAVWPDGASWTDEYTGVSNGVLWAPDCTFMDGQFYLYYAASSFGSQNSAIFFAKSTTGLPGSWTNEGLVTSTSSADNYNAIDPNLLVDGSSWLLSLGSFWTGIKELTLSSSTGKPSSTALTSLAERTADGGAIEASVVYQFGDFFYLFSSWDLCCQGTSSTYNIRVGRSSSATGPFVDEDGVALTSGGGTLILGTHDAIVGPGGQDILTDTDGVILVYHYYTSTGSFLGLNHLDFSSGWPVVTA
ncbi:glycoside hydrolase family 43 protein [Stereum hirsutum FP-91666 SS1]|uniref:glycoside hydrolase family 43 protein n=1 Tax=Stereum hirsutum (strain FP-91666) TaxID=721885 RepID=UPI000440C244|nr:glycoside hydrolase family 43 protein [Stereum hirsutum FP-91666 SS1]EIM88636.1 glycoside hydrolase family 43 protein [Stereum hirsutum FP-91666 SS1]